MSREIVIETKDAESVARAVTKLPGLGNRVSFSDKGGGKLGLILSDSVNAEGEKTIVDAAIKAGASTPKAAPAPKPAAPPAPKPVAPAPKPATKPAPKAEKETEE